MKLGMLWFDNDPKTSLAEKVAKAAGYYRQKYGKEPNRCYVHPSQVPAEPVCLGGVMVQAAETVQPNHLWIGLDQDKEGTNDQGRA